jgi:nucleoporin NDC1
MALTRTAAATSSNTLLAPRSSTLPSTSTQTAPSTTRPPPPAPAAKRVRTYKDFLTPALHRRFGYAALLVLGLCYIESIFLSQPSLLWIWNPISMTGIRALLLFLPCLAVFIIRVANIHCGELLSASLAEGVFGNILQWKGLHTLCWYLYSAGFFAEVYIWSTSKADYLGWVDWGQDGEWALLNENPIFLRALLYSLAVAQTVIHLSKDYDRIPASTKQKPPTPETAQPQPSNIPRALQDLWIASPILIGRIARLVVPGLAFTIPTYFLFLRSLLWPTFYSIGHTLFPNIASQSRPTGLIHMTKLVWQCLSSSTYLVLLWEVSSAAFTIYVARPPLSKGEDQPLTGLVANKEKVQDPNHSLITGLKAKREPPRTFAFWELNLICADFPIRRKTIYTEVDRKDGSTWSQISKICLDEITAIQTRIKATQPAAQPQPPSKDLVKQPKPENLAMPKIADRSVQNGDIWTKPKSDFGHTVGNMARSFGQSHGSSSPLVPRARQAIDWAVSKDQQANLTPSALGSWVEGQAIQSLQMPIGEPFRRTFRRKMKNVILDAPVSKYSTIIHASRSLAALCEKSLKEDDYAQVAKSIPAVVRTYMETIQAVRKFVQSVKPDWTDVFFTERNRNVPEVEAVVEELRQGLEQVVLVFGEYADAVGITKKELREAREVISGTGRGR